MGRTLHFGVVGPSYPNRDLAKKVLEKAEYYNTHHEWSNGCLTWGIPKPEPDRLPGRSFMNDFDRMYKAQKKLERVGWNQFEAIDRLVELGLSKQLGPESGWASYCKVNGNEVNALLVLRFVQEVSEFILPEFPISLSDEGPLLYAPLLLLAGKAKPDCDTMKENLEYWADKDYLHNGGPWDLTVREQYYGKLLAKVWDYGDITPFVRPMKASVLGVNLPESGYVSLADVGQGNLLVNSAYLSEKEDSAKFYDNVKEFPVNV